MDSWINALALWWGVAWRFYLSIFLLLLTSIALMWVLYPNLFTFDQGVYSFNVSSPQDGAIIAPIILILTFVLIGLSAKHLLTRPFGSKRFSVSSFKGSGGDVTWGDGFTLQWALHWRSGVLYCLYSIIIIMFEIGKTEIVLIDDTVLTSYSAGWIEGILPIIFGIVSARHLLYKSYGNRDYLVNIK